MNLARVEVGTDPSYTVHVGAGALGGLHEELDTDHGCLILADATVADLHDGRLDELQQVPRELVQGGEEIKTLACLERVLDRMAEVGLSRHSTLITFGGGTVTDLGGLAASLYKRGMGVIHCPTTLLSQVDAAVGGKTAVNLAAGKNLAGTFHQPRAVFADTETLRTLPASELASGLGEVVKTALLGGEDLLETVERNAAQLATGDPGALTAVVSRCISVKAEVVVRDPEEDGPRRALNLGHTFAHAIERCAGYGRVPHGVAVAVGLCLALRASALSGHSRDDRLEARLRELLERLSLPTSLAALRTDHALELSRDSLLESIAHDKKGRVGQPEFVLLEAPGSPILGVVLEPALLSELIA